MLQATLTRDAPEAPTVVRVGAHAPVALPDFDDPEREPAIARLAALLETVSRASDPVQEIDGSIRTRRRGAAFVPHGDVVAVLDAFHRAGLDHVEFEGAPMPFPRPGNRR